MNLYQIRDWDRTYENNRTRELKQLAWVPIPNKQDGDGYTAIMSLENGPAIFGAWIACVQIASRCDPRGTLVRDGGKPHDPHSLARMSRMPAGLIEEMLSALSGEDINWLTITIYTNPASSCDATALSCDLVAPRARARPEQKEGKERMELSTHTPSDPKPFEPTKAKPQPKPGVRVNGEKNMDPKFQVDTRIQNFASKLSKAYNRPDRPVTDYAELSALAEVCRRPDASSELDCILLFKASLPSKDQRYFPQSVSRLLVAWTETLDRARNYRPTETLSDKITKEVFDDVDRTLRNLERPE